MDWNLSDLRKHAVEVSASTDSRKRIPNQRTLDILSLIKEQAGCSHSYLAKKFSCSTNGLFQHLKYLVESEQIIISKMPIRGGYSWSIFPFGSGQHRTTSDYIRPTKQSVRLSARPSTKVSQSTSVQYERVENIGTALSNEDFSPFAKEKQ
jgi:hypothetical protein